MKADPRRFRKVRKATQPKANRSIQSRCGFTSTLDHFHDVRQAVNEWIAAHPEPKHHTFR